MNFYVKIPNFDIFSMGNLATGVDARCSKFFQMIRVIDPYHPYGSVITKSCDMMHPGINFKDFSKIIKTPVGPSATG